MFGQLFGRFGTCLEPRFERLWDGVRQLTAECRGGIDSCWKVSVDQQKN